MKKLQGAEEDVTSPIGLGFFKSGGKIPVSLKNHFAFSVM